MTELPRFPLQCGERRALFGSLFAWLMCIAAALPAGAQEGEVIVLRAARLLDVRTGELIAPGVVVVEGEHIRSTGAQSVPANARVIDLGELTLLPDRVALSTGERPRILDFPSFGVRILQLMDPDGNIIQLSSKFAR